MLCKFCNQPVVWDSITKQWYEEHYLIQKIMGDVFGEGGDGWGWIQTSDPNKWSTAVYNAILNLGYKKDLVIIEFVNQIYSIAIDQEGWAFSEKECAQPNFYDVIYKIE